MKTALSAACLMGFLLAVQPVQATLHLEGFEDPGYAPGGNNWNNFGGATISRVPSGFGGITSSDGVAHAVLTTGNGPFTRFGGYRTDFNGGFTASVDVYLDPSTIAAGTGFDYSVAANSQSNAHVRDFIFHVGNVGGSLLVNASNNTDSTFNSFKILNENGGNNVEVTSAGWYTFEHSFRDDAGALAVDLNLRDSSGSLLYSITRSNPADSIATVVGGNRYGWFTYNSIDGLAIDNTSLSAIPEPTAALFGALLTTGLGATIARRRREDEAAIS